MDPSSRPRGRRTAASPDRLLTAGERRSLLVGLALTSLAVAAAAVATQPRWARLFDNVHWTVAYGFAAGLAMSAARRATGTLRRARWWFAAGLGALFGGQVLWDVQVAVGWNPFPGPSDGLFASMGVLLAIGAWALTRSQSKPRRIAVLLDGLGFGLSVLALSLALYIPEQGEFGPFTLAVLAAYPTALLTATALLAMVLLELREAPRWHYLLLLAGVGSQGALWMAWNRLTLENRLGDATLLNVSFSYSALLVGVGVATFAPAGVEVGGRLARGYDIVSRLLPLGFVIAAAAAVAGSSRLLLLPAVRGAVMLCMGGVILVAILRQSLLLEERDRLLAAEEQNRILQQRFAESRRLEALGTLAGGIAHDFNNVLTAILGHAELLALRPGLDAQAQESIHGLRAAATRARDMVRRILAFSRQDAGRPEVVDVVALVHEVVALLRAGLPVRHQLVVVAHQQPRVSIIPAQLHQVLMNLGTNASQAIGERVGTVTFAVSTISVDANDPQLPAGRYAELAVTDDGVGMDVATQSRIFEPFFTTKPRGEGTGLGLSVVHGIVRERGGAVRVSSAVGSRLHAASPAASRRR